MRARARSAPRGSRRGRDGREQRHGHRADQRSDGKPPDAPRPRIVAGKATGESQKRHVHADRQEEGVAGPPAAVFGRPGETPEREVIGDPQTRQPRKCCERAVLGPSRRERPHGEAERELGDEGPDEDDANHGRQSTRDGSSAMPVTLATSGASKSPSTQVAEAAVTHRGRVGSSAPSSRSVACGVEAAARRCATDRIAIGEQAQNVQTAGPPRLRRSPHAPLVPFSPRVPSHR